MSSLNEQVKIAWLDEILLKLKCRNQLHNNNIIYKQLNINICKIKELL
jgi:hypothetical protein